MNEKLRPLIQSYRSATKPDRKKQLIEDIIFAEKKLPDFLLLLDEARSHNFDLDFSKAIIDNFFNCLQTEHQDLLTFYKKVKGRVFESYFIGNIYRKNLPFKTLEYLYLQNKEHDKDLAKIIFQVMVTTAFSVEHFVSLLCYDELSPAMEQNFLVEIKKQNGCMAFWVKAYERARPGSALMLYAEHLLRIKTANRPFDSAYIFYNEHHETKASLILLETVAEMAKTEKELDKIIYVAPRGSKIFLNAQQRKEKLTA
jgi:hypothetical protein